MVQRRDARSVVLAWTRHRARAGIVFLAMSALACLTGCTSSNELGQIQSQIEELRFEILKLQKEGPTKAEMVKMEAELARKIDQLATSENATEAEIRKLQEQIDELEAKLEETNFRLAQLSQQLSATNQELQAVRSAAEVVSTPPPPPMTTRPSDPQTLYDTAYNDHKRGNYDLAILAFSQYLESFPNTELADNAAYWIGESYLKQRKFPKAIESFDEVLTRWEQSDRTESALLQKGLAHLELGQRAQAIVHLQSVICDYGGTDEAQLALKRLEELGVEPNC